MYSTNCSLAVNPFTATLVQSLKIHSIKRRFAIGLKFAGVRVCTFQPRRVTDWSSEGVNQNWLYTRYSHTSASMTYAAESQICKTSSAAGLRHHCLPEDWGHTPSMQNFRHFKGIIFPKQKTSLQPQLIFHPVLVVMPFTKFKVHIKMWLKFSNKMKNDLFEKRLKKTITHKERKLQLILKRHHSHLACK